jgi:chromosome segregation ATPase
MRVMGLRAIGRGPGGAWGGQEASTAEAPSSESASAVLRDLDEQIRRREGELRSKKRAVEGDSRGTNHPQPRAPASTAATSRGGGEPATGDLVELEARISALEVALREIERGVWEEVAPLSERVGKLEQASEKGGEVIANAARAMAQRRAEMEQRLDQCQRAQRNTIHAIRDAQQQMRDQHERELRALREPIIKRLSRLEEIVGGGEAHQAIEQRLAETIARLAERTDLAQTIETRLTRTIEMLSARLESLDGRLREAEQRAVGHVDAPPGSSRRGEQRSRVADEPARSQTRRASTSFVSSGSR